MTFVAEFIDRLTGPSTKAKKAVEDLGKASENAAKTTDGANKRVEQSERRRAKTARDTATTVAGSERRRARATQDTTRATERGARAQSKAAQATAQAIQAHGRRANRELGATRSSANRTASALQSMATRGAADLGFLSGAWGRTATSVDRSSRRMHRATGLVRAQGMAKDWNSAMDSIVRRTAGSVSEVENTLSSMGSKAKMGGALVGGMALAGGAKRIADVQQADVVMETMGMSDKDRGNMMGQFKGLAQDTPFSTGSIAALGSGLISSGMDQSKVHDALQGAIDTSATYGMSLEEMALPLKQIQAKGKAQGDDMMQLMDRNIPMMDWIAKQKGVDKSQVQDLVSKGQVSADDVFSALAANSEGGAEKAAGTLKGSFTNFTSSLSQAGEAFLSPMTDDLTEFLQVAKESVNSMKPALSVLGEFGGILLKVLKPTLPVLIPLIAAGGAAFTAYRSVKTATALLGFFAGRRGVGGVVEALLGSRGATALTSIFGGELRSTGRHAKSSTRQLGGLTDMLGNTTRKMDRGAFSAKGLAKNFGLAAAAAGGLAAAGAGMEGLNKLNADLNPSGAENSIATGGDVNAEMKGKDWANKNGSILGGTMSGVNGIGDVINKKQNMGWGDKATGWLGHGAGKILHYGSFGAIPEYKDGWDKAFDSLTEQDNALASLVGTPGAGQRWNSILGDAHRAGVSDSDTLAAFPNYKAAVTDRLSNLTPPVKADDNTLLQYMGNTSGYRKGGFTGMGAGSAVAGLVHRNEYVMPEAVTSRPGMLPALRQIHRTGEVPGARSASNVRHGDVIDQSMHVQVSANTAQDAAVIKAELERFLAQRERRAANRHGTRELRGAH
ncbi:tape measure protein [Kocuria varians]|nr:tape measure protein [Kocuria varians]